MDEITSINNKPCRVASDAQAIDWYTAGLLQYHRLILCYRLRNSTESCIIKCRPSNAAIRHKRLNLISFDKSEQTGLSPPFKKLASNAVKQIFKILTILVFLNVIRDRKCKKWICSLQESLAIVGNSREYEKW